ncbi:MAG: hypothetical protein ACQUYJ_19155, partial [Ferruginibacter sp.]
FYGDGQILLQKNEVVKSSALYLQKTNKNGINQKEHRTFLDIIFTFRSRLFCSIILSSWRLLLNGASV